MVVVGVCGVGIGALNRRLFCSMMLCIIPIEASSPPPPLPLLAGLLTPRLSWKALLLFGVASGTGGGVAEGVVAEDVDGALLRVGTGLTAAVGCM